jgi:uncharacterized protein involved in tellurium resistance
MSDPEEQCLKVKSLKAVRMIMSYSNIGEAVMAWTEGNGVKVITRTAGAVESNRPSDGNSDF